MHLNAWAGLVGEHHGHVSEGFFLRLKDGVAKATWESYNYILRKILNRRPSERSLLADLKVFLVGPHLQGYVSLSSKPATISLTCMCVVYQSYSPLCRFLSLNQSR